MSAHGGGHAHGPSPRHALLTLVAGAILAALLTALWASGTSTPPVTAVPVKSPEPAPTSEEPLPSASVSESAEPSMEPSEPTPTPSPTRPSASPSATASASPTPTPSPTKKPTPGYDLIVTAVRITGDAKAGTPVRFQASVRNRGSDPTPGGIVHGVRFDLNGAVVSFSTGHSASIAPGDTVVITADGAPLGGSPVWTAVAGRHRVRAWVDDVNRLPGELDENNNKKTRTIVIE